MSCEEKYVLAVGFAGGVDALVVPACPVRAVDTGSAALRCLRKKIPEVVISHWQLPDMPDGTFFRQMLAGGMGPTTVALVQPGDRSEEVAARGLGISAVVDETVDAASLSAMLGQLAEAGQSNRKARQEAVVKRFGS